MELKKNPSKDIHRRYPLHFTAGLCISCVVVIGLFEMKFRQQSVDVPDPVEWDHDMMIMDATIVEERPAEEIKKQQTPVQVIRTIIPTVITVATAPVEETEPVHQGDPFEPAVAHVAAPALTVRSDEPLVAAEEMPEPLEGFQKFYRQLGRELRYPRKAANAEIEGKVFVEFVVDREGNPTLLKIISGIGYGCDEEAMKVLMKTKWKPGRQHGVPVRVRMVMPIKFALTN